MSSIRRALALAAVLAWVPPATASAAGPSFASATRGEAPRACPAGSFIDLRLDDPSKGAECWRCPEGTVRTLEAVTSPRACTQPSSTTFDDAKFEHSWTCDGSKREFYDPRKGGECWSCPKNRPRRTAYAVTSKKACATKELIGEKLSEAWVAQLVASLELGHDIGVALVPVRTPHDHYVLVVDGLEGTTTEHGLALASRLEAALATTHHYRHARALGQLGPARVVAQRGALEWLRAAEARRGVALGNIKDRVLVTIPADTTLCEQLT
jgi:hypothetical protein